MNEDEILIFGGLDEEELSRKTFCLKIIKDEMR
jgi:hypothetical protein